MIQIVNWLILESLFADKLKKELDMTISDMILTLKEIMEEHGDIEVKVAYREGAEYEEYDDSVYAEVSDEDGEKIFLIQVYRREETLAFLSFSLYK